MADMQNVLVAHKNLQKYKFMIISLWVFGIAVAVYYCLVPSISLAVVFGALPVFLALFLTHMRLRPLRAYIEMHRSFYDGKKITETYLYAGCQDQAVERENIWVWELHFHVPKQDYVRKLYLDAQENKPSFAIGTPLDVTFVGHFIDSISPSEN